MLHPILPTDEADKPFMSYLSTLGQPKLLCPLQFTLLFGGGVFWEFFNLLKLRDMHPPTIVIVFNPSTLLSFLHIFYGSNDDMHIPKGFSPTKF
jgi:hypothetical protein